MANIIINNYGTLNVYESTTKAEVSEAKDKLLNKMYYARNKETLGGKEGWHKLLDMYYSGDYEGMCEFINSCKGYGGKTRKACLEHLSTIMDGEC